jgi:LCP family protein required for cell wall assembly
MRLRRTMASPTPVQDESPRPPRSRRWIKRVLIGCWCLANVSVFFVYWQLRTIENAVVESADTIPEADFDEILAEISEDSAEPVTFLIIGSDSREGLDDLRTSARPEGERADVIILLQVHPDDGTAQMLSIPRDLWVDIPGHGSNKINAAFAFGGAPLMVETVTRETGIPINHYMQVDFVGFQAIVDELGGVPINFPFPARDTKSGLRVEAGSQTLNGSEALAFARSRTYQELQNGSWVSVDANDIGRTRRQQQLIFSIIRTVARPSSIPELGNIVESFAQHLTIDSRLAEGSMIELGWRLRGVRPDNIAAATLPTYTDSIGRSLGGVAAGTRGECGAVGVPGGSGPLDNGELMRITCSTATGSREAPATGAASSSREVSTSPRWGCRAQELRYHDDSRPARRRPTRGEISKALGFGIVEVGTVGQEVDALVVLGADVADAFGIGRRLADENGQVFCPDADSWGMSMNVAVLGAGYVGLVQAAGLTSLGHHVRLGESNPQRVDELRARKIPIFEPGLGELIERAFDNQLLTVHESNLDAVDGAQVIFLTLPTPPSERRFCRPSDSP